MVKYLTFGIATKIIIHNKLKENEDLKEKINRLNKTYLFSGWKNFASK